jgi:hypothetical protein
MTDGQAQHVTLCAPGARLRSFARTVERVPARAPGQRRSDAWHEAWWQPALMAHAAAAAEAPAGAAMDAEAARQYLAEAGEAGGWASIRPGNYRSFDTLVKYSVADAQGCQQTMSS